MSTGTIAPFPKHQFFDDNGDPAVGYQLFAYEAGTTTKLATYTDAALTVANTNPIVLDAAGRCTIFLSPASYKFVLEPPVADGGTDPPTSPEWTVDNVYSSTPYAITNNIDLSGVAGETLVAGNAAYLSNGTGSLTAGRWYKTSSSYNYASVDAAALGIVTVGGAAGAAVTIRTSGRATPGGTYTAGTVYYLGATAGSLSASATQTNRCPFAQADSTTTVVFPIGGTVSISIKNALAVFAYGGTPTTGVNGCNATATDTELTGYPVTVPDNYLDTYGAALVVEGTLVLASNTNLKTMSVGIGTTGVLEVFSNASNVANHRVPFRFNIIRRNSNTAALTGIWYYGGGNQTQCYGWLANHVLSTTVDWTASQTLKVYLKSAGSVANDIYLTDYFVYSLRSPYGSLV